MLKLRPKQLSLYSILYDKIPTNHILKMIAQAVDFSFINKLLEKSYSKTLGRPAKEPEMMAKLLILQYLYNLSDVKVIEEAGLNLAYLWFLGVNPEEDLPDASLLAKFRTQRLQETSVDDVIQEVVRQCIEKGIIKGSGMSIDATHVIANTVKKVPERIMKHLAKKIFRVMEEEAGSVSEEIDTSIPDYKTIEDHQQAKAIMKSYLEQVIQIAGKTCDSETMPRTKTLLDEAKKIIEEPQFILQKGIRSLVDQDARVGHKSKTDSFYGYKVEFAMIPEERIITAVTAAHGAYVDGEKFNELYEGTKKCGVKITSVYGDKAYFRKPILDLLKEEKVETLIPVSQAAYKIDESKFSYNKDSDQWFCHMGNYTVSKVYQKTNRKNDVFKYTFDKVQCKNCICRSECTTAKSGAKRLGVSVNVAEYYEYNQWAKTEEFKGKYKKRASHEWKNGEIKRFHGLDRARGYGLKSVMLQGKLTALAVNLKRIASLLLSLFMQLCSFLSKGVDVRFQERATA